MGSQQGNCVAPVTPTLSLAYHLLHCVFKKKLILMWSLMCSIHRDIKATLTRSMKYAAALSKEEFTQGETHKRDFTCDCEPCSKHLHNIPTALRDIYHLIALYSQYSSLYWHQGRLSRQRQQTRAKVQIMTLGWDEVMWYPNAGCWVPQ